MKVLVDNWEKKQINMVGINALKECFRRIGLSHYLHVAMV